MVRRVALAAGVVVTCVLPVRAAAQVQDAATLSLDSLLNVKVTAASRHEQNAWDAPSSVTIITAEEIRLHGYETLEDVLAQVPGLYVANDRNYGSVGVRGFSRPTDYNNRLLLLLNGHPLNDAVYGQAQTGTELGLSLRTLDRIEVVRGPGSSLYGDNAMFAVINLVTRKPSSVAGVQVDLAAGSSAQRHGTVQAGGGLARNVAFLAMAEWGYDGGSDFAMEVDGVPLVFERLDRDEHRGVYVEVAAGPVTVRTRRSERWKRIPTASWGTDPGDARARTYDAWSLVGVEWVHRTSPRLSLQASGWFDEYEYLGFYPYDDEMYDDGNTARRLMTEAQVTWDPSAGTRVIAGGEYRHHARADYWLSYEGSRYFDRNEPFDTWSVYVQSERQVTRELMLVLGLRRDEVQDGTSFTAPRAALVFRPDARTSLKALHGTAFRQPNFYEKFFDDGEDTWIPPTGLDPEQVRTTELVVERRLASSMYGTVSAYHSQVRDLIDAVTVDDVTQFANRGRVTATGFEAAVRAGLAGGVVKASYSYGRATSDGEPLTDVPAHIGRVMLSMPLSGMFRTGIHGRYETGRLASDGTRTDAFLVADVNLMADEILPGLTPSLRIRNVLDREYALPGGAEHRMSAITQRGRELMLGLEYRFQVRR